MQLYVQSDLDSGRKLIIQKDARWSPCSALSKEAHEREAHVQIDFLTAAALVRIAGYTLDREEGATYWMDRWTIHDAADPDGLLRDWMSGGYGHWVILRADGSHDVLASNTPRSDPDAIVRLPCVDTWQTDWTRYTEEWGHYDESRSVSLYVVEDGPEDAGRDLQPVRGMEEVVRDSLGDREIFLKHRDLEDRVNAALWNHAKKRLIQECERFIRR